MSLSLSWGGGEGGGLGEGGLREGDALEGSLGTDVLLSPLNPEHV